jgi:hypothetical protein
MTPNARRAPMSIGNPVADPVTTMASDQQLIAITRVRVRHERSASTPSGKAATAPTSERAVTNKPICVVPM